MENVKRSKSKQKKYYDRKAKAVQFFVGNKVLFRKTLFESKHKIEDRYEEKVYTVVEKSKPNTPV